MLSLSIDWTSRQCKYNSQSKDYLLCPIRAYMHKFTAWLNESKQIYCLHNGTRNDN